MNNRNDKCDHDFLGVLHCKKCGQQYHTNWPDALGHAKIEAMDEILRKIETTINMKSIGKTQKEAHEILKKAVKEVRKVHDESENLGENRFDIKYKIKK
jgi:hypothetical protein